ncbi:MAG: trimethylamine methyltransferase family protein [Acidimicrobiales bacterium]
MTPGASPVTVLSEEQLELVHDRAMTILEDIGVEIRQEAALRRLAEEGQKVEDSRVRFDRGFVLEVAARAPASFTVRSRSDTRSITLGGGSLVHTPAGGAPFCSDRDRGRRDGTLADHVELVKLAHTTPLLRCQQSGVVEAADLDDVSRHLDMDYACLRWSDKPYICYGGNGARAADAVSLAAIACGGRDRLEAGPRLIGVVNSNSPLVWDGAMVDALTVWAEANQAVAVTPFLLAGATAPLGLAGGLAQQIAEALAGVVVAQLVRPGTPCVFGSFLSAVDMRSGGPAFGMPAGVLGTLAGGQIARRYGLPYRGGGGLCSGMAVDAQSASESLNMLWATYLSGCDLVLHAAGWLEAGLTTSYEKLAIDLEVLAMFEAMRGGIVTDEAHFAIDTIREEGPGGMFLAAPHTLEHFREWVFMSPLFRATAHPNWVKQGSPTADQVATTAWRALLESYEDPGMDDAVDEELRAFVAAGGGQGA